MKVATTPNQFPLTHTEAQQEMDRCHNYEKAACDDARLLDVYRRTHLGERAYRARLRHLLTQRNWGDPRWPVRPTSDGTTALGLRGSHGVEKASFSVLLSDGGPVTLSTRIEPTPT